MADFAVTVTIAEIRNALADRFDREDLGDLDEGLALDIENASISQGDVDEACSLCGGQGLPDPEPQVDPRLVGDFIASINRGDLATARALVGRVFEDMTDIRVVDAAICRCLA